MSTNTHEQSKTCTDIVNWLQRTMASVERATHAAKVAGRTHETPAAWSAARADARAAEDEVVALLSHAAAQVAHATGAARHPGAAAAVLTLQTGGWKYKVGDERWTHPGTYGQDSDVLATEELRRQGYTWSANLAVWMPPAPSADAQRAQAAEATLGGLGWEWAPKRSMWVCTAPAKPDVPQSMRSAEGVLVRMGWRYNGTSNVWEGPVLDPKGHDTLREAAQAVITARYQGLLTAEMDQALNALVDALGGGARPAFPPARDAEECRNAALEVLRAARGEDFSPLLSKALTHLAAAVHRKL